MKRAALPAHFAALKVAAWLIAFAGCAWFLNNYEVLMNAGQGLGASGYVWVAGKTTNLFNEGPIGYAALALMSLSAAVFVRELQGFTRVLKSLSNSDKTFCLGGGESFV